MKTNQREMARGKLASRRSGPARHSARGKPPRPDFSLENAAGSSSGRIVAGVDEVGRGAIAGPVMAAAVIMDPKSMPSALTRKIKDSKMIARPTREALYDSLAPRIRFAVGAASAAEVDRLNVLNASLLAMARAIERLPEHPDMVLVDGNRVPAAPCPTQAVVAGDSKSLSIAAASIIAKVTRDRLMTQLAQVYPGYGWEHNCGYATMYHLAALLEHGPTAEHRRSFHWTSYSGAEEGAD